MKFKPLAMIGLGTILILGGCRLRSPDEMVVPTWHTNLEFPIMETSVGLKEILDDSLITTIPVNADGDSIFAFRDTVPIERVEVGDQLSIDDIHKSFSQSVDDVSINDTNIDENIQFDEVGIDEVENSISSEVGPIELDNIPPSSPDPIQLNEIYPDINSIPDGNTTTIPSFTIDPIVRPFAFDDFDEAVFTAGNLDVTIVNDMVITLGTPVTIQFQHIVGPDTVDITGASVVFNSAIASGDSSTETMDLTGITLPGNILVNVSGSSSGTDGNSITVNQAAKESSFITRIEAGDLTVSAATAEIPEQVIDEIGVIELASDSNKVEDAEILNGTLAIDIENTMAVESNLNLVIQSLENQTGNQFSQQINIPPNSNESHTYPIDDHHLIMAINNQQVDYSYQVTTVPTAPGKISITESDSIVISLRIYGEQAGDQITFKSFTGIIKPQNEIRTGSMDMESDSEILEADLSDGILSIDIENGINASTTGAPTLTIQIDELVDATNQPLVLGPEVLSPGTNLLEEPLESYRLVLPRNDQALHYQAKVVTEYGEVGDYNLTDSIDVNIAVTGLTFESVTGYFSQDAIVDSSTIELDNATKVEEAEMNTGMLTLTMTNRMGVVADARFTIEEFLKDGESLDTTVHIEDTESPQVFVIPLTDYWLTMPLDSQQVHYISRVSLPDDEQMTLLFGDSLDVDVDITELSFASVTGDIDPVQVDIDTVEQEVTALPDEMNGIDFNNVNLIMDFDTNIGLPVILSLNLTATNADGVTEVASVQNWNVAHPDSHQVLIPDAERLLNIQPQSIVATGQAQVGRTGTNGTVSIDQFIEGNLTIDIPLELILTDEAEIDTDPELMENDIPEELDRMVLYARSDNQFEFGAQVEVLAADDTLIFDGTSPGSVDTLFVLDLEASKTDLDSIVMDASRWDILRDSTYIKSYIHLLGLTDDDGNPEPSRFLSTDSLSLLLYGKARVLVDLENAGGED